MPQEGCRLASRMGRVLPLPGVRHRWLQRQTGASCCPGTRCHEFLGSSSLAVSQRRLLCVSGSLPLVTRLWRSARDTDPRGRGVRNDGDLPPPHPPRAPHVSPTWTRLGFHIIEIRILSGREVTEPAAFQAPLSLCRAWKC